jgi:hypothetical protein
MKNMFPHPVNNRLLRKMALFAFAWFGLSVLVRDRMHAQPVQQPLPAGAVVQMQDGQPVVVTPGESTPPPTADAKPEEAKEAKKEGDAKEKEADATTVKRPKEPPEPPNKREFDVRPDEDGMIQFQFRNQGWPEIMKWLAEVSNMSLDWQELPADFLSIATQGKASLEETRDSINRRTERNRGL